MLFLIALVGAVLIGLLVWKVLSLQREGTPNRPAPPTRKVSGPDDDPEFLRQLEQRFRADEDPPQPR
jgi:hypothetical protein